ncbi:MAG: hypothetical protein AB1571_04320 [Nanoarchaeota archaeon]
MRDLVLFSHIILGLVIVVLTIIILIKLKGHSRLIKPLAFVTAAVSWLLLLPAGRLYITFYPATKMVIKAGTKSWAHSVVMETKEHWGLLLPFIATLATALVFRNEIKESKKWWALLLIISLLLGLMGRIVKFGAMP